MATKPRPKPKAKSVPRPFPLGHPEIELRRWCIEQATRWPVMQTTTYGGGLNQQAYIGGGVGGSMSTTSYADVDLVARAEKIRAWLDKA